MERTLRQNLIDLLMAEPLTAKDISALLHIPEKEVFGHLSHVAKSAQASGHRLVITPSVCRSCGFVFNKRTKLTKPGKCPICKGTYCDEPLFALQEER